MAIRKTLFIAKLVLINVAICLFWWALILDRPERTRALVVLLPLQVVTNVLAIGITKRMRISGLTVVFVLGLIFGLFDMFITRNWWLVIDLPLLVVLIVWSVNAHRRALSKRIVNDGTEE